MDKEKQIQSVLKNHLPGTLTTEQHQILEPRLSRLAGELVNVEAPTINKIAAVLRSFPVFRDLLAFHVDFTDTNQLFQEILDRLKKK